jgi:hypothetical protein
MSVLRSALRLTPRSRSLPAVQQSADYHEKVPYICRGLALNFSVSAYNHGIIISVVAFVCISTLAVKKDFIRVLS